MTKSNKLPKELWAAAWTIALGAIAPMLDSTMMNIAIQPLTHIFHTSLSMIQWSVTGYILTIALTVPFAGWLMRRFEGKRLFLFFVFFFGVTSALAGISWSVESFIFFRILQGICAGVITPLMSTLLVKTAGPEALGRVMAIVSTPMIFGPILGPVLGGVILQFLSWRWLFFINVFLTLLIVPLIYRFLPTFEPADKRSRLDGFGLLLLSGMSVSLLYGITKAADAASFTSPAALLFVGIGLVCLCAYWFYDRKKGHQTVLPLSIFQYRHYMISSIGLFLANAIIMGPMILLPLFFQNLLHLSPTGSAVALIPQGIGMLVTRPIIGKWTDAKGAKIVVLVSLIVSFIGTLPFLFVTNETPLSVLAFLLFLRGTSFGGILLPMTTDAYTSMDEHDFSTAGVGITIIENLGSSLGNAVIATVVAAGLSGGIPSIQQQVSAYHAGFLVCGIGLLLLMIPSLFLTSRSTSQTSSKTEKGQA